MLNKSLIDLLLPRACLLCGALTGSGQHVCQPCLNSLPILSHSCRKCAQFLHHSLGKVDLCGQCLANPPPFDRVYALFAYESPLPSLIAAFKFEEQFSHGRFFSAMMIRKIHAWYRQQSLPDLILPVPLHPARLRERGFNQAKELALPVASHFNIKLDHQVQRHKATATQHKLPKRERAANLVQAFSTSQYYHGLHIAIVDDVMTTGQTVAALASLLKEHGARQIDIWCVARRSLAGTANRLL